jgi:hypothetical protein
MIRFLSSPLDTMTHPTFKRLQLDREAIRTAVAMKYSSQEGRPPVLSTKDTISSSNPVPGMLSFVIFPSGCVGMAWLQCKCQVDEMSASRLLRNLFPLPAPIPAELSLGKTAPFPY